MAQAASQTELMSALNNHEPTIQITSGFSVASQINITYTVRLESASGQLFTLSRSSSYPAYLFRVRGGGSLTLDNIVLDGSSSAHPADVPENRSLILVTGGSLELLGDTVIRNNNSYLEGGGIYLKSSADFSNALSISGNVQVTGCYSRTSGGGVMIASENAGDSISITGNVAIDGNQAASGGGILYRCYSPDAGASLSIGDQVRLTGNSASATGGGISFSGYREGGGVSSSLTFSGGAVISGNSAVHGAGIYFYSANAGDQMTLQDISISQNTASQNGGGCYMTSVGVPGGIVLEGASITDNTAGTGGGIYFLTNAGGTLSVSRGTVTGNRAAGGDAGTGGGIWIQNTSTDTGVTVLINGSSLEQNTASAHAGGIALYGGGGAFSFRITESSITDNQAGKEGGGLVVANSGTGTLSFIQASVLNNTAAGSGGGIYYANTGSGVLTTFILSNSDFSGNTAGYEGGGMRLTSGSGSLITSLTDCTVNANTARDNSGGGIWNGGADNVLTLDGTSSVTQNSTGTGNGGGIYFNSENGSIYLSDNTQVSYNLAEAPGGFGGHGGGICLVPGTLNIQDQTVLGFNRAGKYGGGISASGSSRINISGGILHGNHSASFGGGIWIHDGSTAVITGGSFSGCQAPYGGDIYNDSHLYLSGDRIFADGVYLENRRSVIQLRNALTGTPLIQLESSDYVTPNREGIPIVVGEADRDYPVLSQRDADAFQKPVNGFGGWQIRLSDDHTQILLAPVLYQIHYENLMGSEQPNPDTYTVETPDIELLPPSPLPGYRFLGWFDALSGGNEITAIPRGSTGDITLYARWETAVPEYLLTFCGNACRPEACCIPDPITFSSGESILLPDLIPKRRGYLFCGWNTAPHGDGECFHPGEMLYALRHSLTLYAVWKRRWLFWR